MAAQPTRGCPGQQQVGKRHAQRRTAIAPRPFGRALQLGQATGRARWPFCGDAAARKPMFGPKPRRPTAGEVLENYGKDTEIQKFRRELLRKEY